MSFANPIVEAGVEGLGELYRTRAVTPAEATEVYLSRIDRLDGPLHSYLFVDEGGARAAAAASAARGAAGAPLSPVDGAPVAVKANIAVEGWPWHAGIAAYRERRAGRDAAVIARLRAAGAVLLGVVNQHEGALGATTDNPAFGRTHNPHRHGYTPGGSSGGSGASVAAGLCAAALGTDTLGSARIPSAYCGVFGFKPARGRLDEAGVAPLSWTLDQVGVHARSTHDVALLLNVMGGETATVEDLRPWAVLAYDGQVGVQPEMARAFEDTATHARAGGFRLASEPLRLEGYDFGRVRRAGLLISEAEGAAVHEAALAADPDGFSPDFAGLLRWGAGQSALKLAKAHLVLREASAALRAALGPYAGVLTPAAPQAAFAFSAEVPANQADFTALANVADLPAAVFPAGRDAEGLPLSVQAIGWGEGCTLAAARRLTTPVGAPAEFRG